MTEPSYCDLTESDLIIPSGADIFWTYPRQIRSNVLVQSGGKLTIRCDVGMPQGARITVEANGELVVEGARIYSNCDDRWEGMVVKGNSAQHQTKIGGVRHQGYVQIKEGSTIENMSHGIRLYDPEDVQGTSGGVLQAGGTTFLNNRYAADFAPYQGFHFYTGEPVGNASIFSNCTFVVDDNYHQDAYPFEAGVNLRGVSGIRFVGCSFSNEMTDGPTPGNKKQGIYSHNSDFSVQGRCTDAQPSSPPCQNYERSGFRGFTYGINAQNAVGGRTFRVSRTDFRNNQIGVFSNKVDYFSVTHCSFEVGIDYEVPKSPFYEGIHALGSSGYKIEENTFVPSATVPGGSTTIGVAAVSSGPDYNEIYRNDFDGLTYANLSNASNRHPIDPVLGLQYLCNSNGQSTVNQFDIRVPQQGGGNTGIARNQGSSQASAGNVFNHTSPPDNETHLYNHLPASSNNYYYFGSSEQPTNYSRPPFFSPQTVFPATAASPNSCISKIPFKEEGPLTEGEFDQHEQEFSNPNTETTKRRYAANMLVRDLLTDTSGQDYGAVRQLLVDKADFMSRLSVVDIWLLEDQPDSADQALAAIPSQFVLTDDEQAEYGHWATLKNMQISAQQNGMDEAQMVAANESAISQLAEAGEYRASFQARSLVNTYIAFTYGPVVVVDDEGFEGLIAPP